MSDYKVQEEGEVLPRFHVKSDDLSWYLLEHVNASMLERRKHLDQRGISVASGITCAGKHHFQETEKVTANGRGSKITVGLCALSVSTISARPCCHTFIIEACSRIARYPCASCASIITTESSMGMFMVERVGCRDGRPEPYSIQKKSLKKQTQKQARGQG